MVDLTNRIKAIHARTGYVPPGEAPKTAGPKVRDFAREFLCEYHIERALTYHSQIADVIWNTPCLWTTNLKTTAGQFSTQKGIILHLGLQQAGYQHKIETFLHEVAHAMQWHAYRKCDHGDTWWEMMHQLGQKPVRTHNIKECQRRASLYDGAFDAKQ